MKDVSLRQCLTAYHSRNFSVCLKLWQALLEENPKCRDREQVIYLQFHSQTRLHFVDDLLDLDDVHLPDDDQSESPQLLNQQTNSKFSSYHRKDSSGAKTFGSNVLTRPRSSRADLQSSAQKNGFTRKSSRVTTKNVSTSLYSRSGKANRLLTASLKFKQDDLSVIDLESENMSKLVESDSLKFKFLLEYAQYVQRNLDFCYKAVKLYLKYHYGAVMGKLFARAGQINFCDPSSASNGQSNKKKNFKVFR